MKSLEPLTEERLALARAGSKLITGELQMRDKAIAMGHLKSFSFSVNPATGITTHCLDLHWNMQHTEKLLTDKATMFYLFSEDQIQELLEAHLNSVIVR